ncbi:MAG TPA: hypothetical protein VMH32_19135 [Burkholderiales bacterium]|nr:hypothetical protein [Burkholderiales bacterium]
MVRWFFELIYGGVPARFESPFSVQESVALLGQVVKPSVFHALTKQNAVGSVTEGKVSIQRVIPWVRNSWKPFFIGSFKTIGGRTVLEGRFTFSPWVKLCMSIWFGFIAIWVVLATIIVIRHPNGEFWFPLFGVGLFAVGILMVLAGKWFGRNDIAWLSQVILTALGADGAQPGARGERPTA